MLKVRGAFHLRSAPACAEASVGRSLEVGGHVAGLVPHEKNMPN